MVLLSYPKEAFGQPKALRAFLSTDVSLSTQEILETYADRIAGRLSRFSVAVKTSWLWMDTRCAVARGFAGIGCSCRLPIIYAVRQEISRFEDGYAYFQRRIQEERILHVYQCGVKRLPVETVLAFIG